MFTFNCFSLKKNKKTYVFLIYFIFFAFGHCRSIHFYWAVQTYFLCCCFSWCEYKSKAILSFFIYFQMEPFPDQPEPILQAEFDVATATPVQYSWLLSSQRFLHSVVFQTNAYAALRQCQPGVKFWGQVGSHLQKLLSGWNKRKRHCGHPRGYIPPVESENTPGLKHIRLSGKRKRGKYHATVMKERRDTTYECETCGIHIGHECHVLCYHNSA